MVPHFNIRSVIFEKCGCAGYQRSPKCAFSSLLVVVIVVVDVAGMANVTFVVVLFVALLVVAVVFVVSGVVAEPIIFLYPRYG